MFFLYIFIYTYTPTTFKWPAKYRKKEAYWQWNMHHVTFLWQNLMFLMNMTHMQTHTHTIETTCTPSSATIQKLVETLLCIQQSKSKRNLKEKSFNYCHLCYATMTQSTGGTWHTKEEKKNALAIQPESKIETANSPTSQQDSKDMELKNQNGQEGGYSSYKRKVCLNTEYITPSLE